METAAISLVAGATRQYPRRPSSSSAITPEASPVTMHTPILLAASAAQRLFMFRGFGVIISHHPIVAILSFSGRSTGCPVSLVVLFSSRIVRDSGVDVFSVGRICDGKRLRVVYRAWMKSCKASRALFGF